MILYITVTNCHTWVLLRSGQVIIVWWKSRKDDRFYNNIQVVYQNKNKKGVSRETGILDFDICAGRISKYLELENWCYGNH